LRDAIAVGYVDNIVVLSNRASLDQATEAFRHGLAYEAKPYDQTQLVELLKRFPSGDLTSAQSGVFASASSPVTVLVVEDRSEWTKVFRGVLSAMPRLDIKWVSDYFEAKTSIENGNFEILILDIRLADEDAENVHGLVLLEDLRMMGSQALVIVTTGYATLELAREAFLRYHVFDFFSKSPASGQFPLDAFRKTVIRAIHWSIARKSQSQPIT
jgi:DNA-binding NtrC family response regulator